MPNIRVLATAVLELFCSQGCSYTKRLCPKKESNSTEKFTEWVQKLISSSTSWSATICQKIRILVKAVLQIFCSQGSSYTKCLSLKKGNNSTKTLQKRFKSKSAHLHLGLYLYAKYQDPSQSSSSDILFTMLFLYKMPVSEEGSNSTKNLQNMFKS